MKIRLLLLLLLTSPLYAQHIYFASGLDVRNAIIGSNFTNNNPELNLLLKFGMVSNNNIEITISYETFNVIDYTKFTFGIGYHIPLTHNLKLIPTVEYGLITRTDNWGGGISYKTDNSAHLAPSISIPLRYDINDNFAVELQGNLTQRTDLNTMYGGNNYIYSNYLNIIYKLNL